MIKNGLAIFVLSGVVLSAHAEPMRTALTKENKMPEAGQVELGVVGEYTERVAADVLSAEPYVRVGLADQVAVRGSLPYLSVDPVSPLADKQTGLGDASLGIEFLGYSDLFDAPWIMPHARVIFDTGDEDKGLSAGDTQYEVGVAVGTTVERVFHFAADARYLILDDQENIPSLGLSLVWDLDERFSLLAEMQISREKDVLTSMGTLEDRHPILFLAGFSYAASEEVLFSVQGGTGKNSDIDTMVRSALSYTF
jgi:hypothetical protein